MAKKYWLEDPIQDRIMQVVVQVARELYITKDRLQVIERLIDERGVISRADIESYEASAEDDDEFAATRDEFIANILAPLTRDDAADQG